ncbi:hypothetical protein, partial [Mesorhizobium sp. B1-1-5]|uniref:hypothetical protein n=1 Tax=Mesorhizobium sp. B1-1-5 TaxID=2589979 RepID=UPI001AEDE8E8
SNVEAGTVFRPIKRIALPDHPTADIDACGGADSDHAPVAIAVDSNARCWTMRLEEIRQH